MKRLFTALCACAVLCGAMAADTKVATREWVRKQLAAKGIRVSLATVSTNLVAGANGSVTTNIVVSSPWTCAELPDCTGISFTLSPGRIVYRRVQAARPTLLNLLAPMLYAADGVPSQTITATVRSGYWEDRFGNSHPFNLGDDGWVLESNTDLPDVPDATHTCELDSDCNCVGYGLSADDIEVPDTYSDITADESKEWVDILNWIDTENWQPQQQIGSTTTYFIRDVDNRLIDIQAIGRSDAWIEAIAQAVVDANKWMKQCRDAYVQSRICDRENPQHRWQTKSCGGNSWSVCLNNSRHTQGTAQHTGHTTAQRCLCGETASPHDIVTDEKVAKTGNTGWTQTTRCILGCGMSHTTDHDCIHEKCKACSAGDGCNWPCPTCMGLHSFGGQTAGRCVRCQCADCGITEREQTGGTVIITIANHSGWEACTEHEDETNERGGGRHCCCECGNYGCADGRHTAINDHLRDDFDPTVYEDCEDDDLHHWAADKSECKRCGDPYGVKEEHQYPEEAEDHQWLSNEKCARKMKCEKCDHEKVDDLETAGSHSPDGEPFQFDDIGDDEHCRWWYHCSQCHGDYYEDNHAHQLPQTPTKWENVSASVCRAVKPCEKCGHEVKEDGEHVKSTVESDGCKCSKCKEYQFAHTLSEDLCGNQSCEICGWVDPEAEETHTGHTKDERCLCGRETKPHVWGDWQYVGRDGDYDVFRRNCTLSCGVSPMEKRVPVNSGETCTGSNHILSPTNDCTCLCGLFNPSAPSTDKNLHTFESGHCLCNCGKYHDKQDWPNPNGSDVCPAVCSVCKTRSASGLNVSAAVVEDEHTEASHRCGCKCGKLNHRANSARFHPKHPFTCRCYGSSGKGDGKWHYPCAFGSAYCPNICSYSIDGKYHIANTGTEPIVASLVIASDDNHTRKDADCGCKCGAITRSNINPQSPLHNTVANSYGCGCFCKTIREPHRIPIGYCSCYCDYTHTNAWENACRVCSKCKDIIIQEIPKHTKADVIVDHKYSPDDCKCACEQKHLHADGHVFDADKCVCRCSDAETRPHILHQTGSSLEASDTCTYCHAQFYDYIKHFECQRCGETLPDVTVTIGMHRKWCRKKYTKRETPTYEDGGCSACGCYCTGGSNTSCGGHYCSSCCSKPKDERKKDKPDYTPPNYPDPCGHPSSTVDNDSYSYTCDKCHRTIQVTDKTTRCATCGIVLDFEYEESEHGEHPPDEEETDENGNTIDRCNCGCCTSDGTRDDYCGCAACQNKRGKCTKCNRRCEDASSSTDSESGTETGGSDDLDDL